MAYLLVLATSILAAAALPSDKAFYDANGYVHIRRVFNVSEALLLSQWVQEIGSFPAAEGKWMHHYESTESGPQPGDVSFLSEKEQVLKQPLPVVKKKTYQLARTENFVSYHPQLGRRLMAGKLPDLVAEMLGEHVFLYKEKINYKYPGGAGYAAHQDAPAYKQIDNHLTALVAIEPATLANGCLEFAAGRHQEGLIGLTGEGIISSVAEANLEFSACEMQPGDVIIFSSYIPHRSRPNLSPQRRALLYLTYNAQSEGYLRDEYYRHKRATMKAGQLSLIKHFQGVALEANEGLAGSAANASCTAANATGRSSSDAVLTELRAMFETHGATMYDPVVTQQEHALQSAALAEAAGASDALVTAALLHDVGHLLLDEHMGNDGFLQVDRMHELAGADFLRPRFPEEVEGAVRLHVPAKRYLCQACPSYWEVQSTNAQARPGYWEGLSPASKRSLQVQGGVHSDAEAAAFIAQPFASAAAQLRIFDDLAKKPAVTTPDLEYYLTGAVARVLSAGGSR